MAATKDEIWEECSVFQREHTRVELLVSNLVETRVASMAELTVATTESPKAESAKPMASNLGTSKDQSRVLKMAVTKETSMVGMSEESLAQWMVDW